MAAAIVMPSDLSPETIAGLAHSVRFYGASVFINLNDFVDDAIGNARVRIIIDAVIVLPDGVAQVVPLQPA